MIKKNKKLSVLAILALFCSCFSCAEILDGGEIQFNGFIIDEAPKWTWRIASTDQFWGVDIADARRSGNEFIFDLNNKGVLPFLEGHLFELAERGGPGFTPFILFSSNGIPFETIEGGDTSSQKFRASVPVYNSDNGNVSGKLYFTLEQAMGVSVAHQNEGITLPAGMSLVSGESVSNVLPAQLSSEAKSRLSSLLLMNLGFGNGMSAASNNQVINQSVLSDGRVTNLAAAYTSLLSDFELRLPAEDTPPHWLARINVTVTVQ
ncbi:TPA: fimbrial protein [Escherichia coli]|nr:fimbrial protein [Escherichia coli]HBA6843018.1 fimbrial protein [Escherichia coli]HBA6856619.1 fimbrial protein [Escherichia coli]HBA8714817.1 fimbrial protein [Escherichia coli]HBA8941834.1 fimbrial protein [Escherichia coli]